MAAVWPDKTDLPDPNDPERAAYRAIRCLPGEIAPNVLVPGDPARAARIARDWLTDAKLVMVQREFHSYTGSYEGVPVSVISTGVGSPGAAMIIQDLGKLGCDVIIRVGTAGSCVKEVKPGDNVVGTAAVRDEGLTRKFLPEIFPAVANLDVTNALCAAGAKRETLIHTGVVHTSDSFRSPALEKDIEVSIYAGVLAFEMEAATVLTISAINRMRAGCIFSIDGYVANVAGGNVVPDVDARNRGIKSAIHTALDAIVSLSAS
jgi:uridine phosphorylase